MALATALANLTASPLFGNLSNTPWPNYGGHAVMHAIGSQLLDTASGDGDIDGSCVNAGDTVSAQSVVAEMVLVGCSCCHRFA